MNVRNGQVEEIKDHNMISLGHPAQKSISIISYSCPCTVSPKRESSKTLIMSSVAIRSSSIRSSSLMVRWEEGQRGSSFCCSSHWRKALYSSKDSKAQKTLVVWSINPQTLSGCSAERDSLVEWFITRLLIYYSTIRLKIRLIIQGQIQQLASTLPPLVKRQNFGLEGIVKQKGGGFYPWAKEINIISTLSYQFQAIFLRVSRNAQIKVPAQSDSLSIQESSTFSVQKSLKKK